MRLKLIHMLAILFVVSSVVKTTAQVNTYGFSSSTGISYVRLTNPNMLPVGADTVLRLPFTFYLDSARTDTLWVSQHGVAAFKKTGFVSSWDYPLTNTLNYKWIMAPFGITLNRVGGGNPSTLKIDTVGTAPNRIFVAEWSNFRVNGATGTHIANFQLWIYETSNKIEFRYGTFVSPTSNESVQVGLRGLTGDFDAGQITCRRPSPNWTTTIPAVSVNGTAMTFASTQKPDSGLLYVWTPPPPCNTISNIGTLPDTIYTCFNTRAILSRNAGAPVVSGLYYQWQISADKVIWNDVTTGIGMNNASYSTDSLKAPMWYRLKATCIPNSQVYYTNATRVKNNAALNLPYSEDFESITNTVRLPECMYSSNTNIWNGYISDGHSGTKFARYTGSGVNNHTLITPGLNLQSGVTYRMSFWHSSSDFQRDDTLRPVIGTFPHKDSMSPVYPTAMLLPNTDIYKHAYFTFTVPATGVYYLGIRGTMNTSGSIDVDDIDIRQVPNVDVTVDSVYAPSVFVPQCYTNATDIKLHISNIGTQPVSNIPVYYKINGTEYGPEIVPGPIAPSANIIYTFTQKANMSGNYTLHNISGRTALAGDNYTPNDSTVPVRFYTDSTTGVPYTENFDGSTFGGLFEVKWKESRINSYNYANIYYLGGRDHTSDFLSVDVEGMPAGLHRVSTLLVGPVTGRSFLQFDYRIVNYSGTTKLNLTTGDTIFVVATTNCGVSYDTLMTIHAGNQPGTNKFTTIAPKSLATYAGSKVRFDFLFKTTGLPSLNIYFDIDNFKVREINPKDVALTALFDMPVMGCMNTAIPVKVAVKNIGGLAASNFNIKADFGSQLGVINYNYTSTLEHEKSDTITIGSFTPANPGTYTFKAYTTLAGDTSYLNDTVIAQVYIPVVPATPMLVGNTICAGNTALLSGLQTDSTTIAWYTSASATTPIYRGAPFVTPVLSSTTIYHAEQVSKLQGRAGKPDAGVSSFSFTNNNWGLILDAVNDSRLDSLAVYPLGAGTITVKIMSCASCATPVKIDSFTWSFTGATGTKTMMPVGTFLPKGNGYFLKLDGYNGISLKRDFPFTDYPYRGTNSSVIVRTAWGNNQAQYDGYYYFYDMAVTAFGCGNGNKTPVTVTVDPKPLPSFWYALNVATVDFTNTSQFGGTYLWDFADGNTSTSASPQHTFTQNGKYYVKLYQTNNCGIDSSAQNVYITALSVNGITTTADEVVLYPNPAKDKLYIRFNAANTSNVQVTILNQAGQIVKEESYAGKAGENTITEDIHNLPAGTYMLSLKNGSELKTLKFEVVKQD